MDDGLVVQSNEEIFEVRGGGGGLSEIEVRLHLTESALCVCSVLPSMRRLVCLTTLTSSGQLCAALRPLTYALQPLCPRKKMNNGCICCTGG